MTTAIIACLIFAVPRAEAQARYTLETYYPSPAGAYENLTVTSQTVVARDGNSSLVVGAFPPPGGVGTKLLVAGGSMASWADFHSYRGGGTLVAAPPAPGRLPPPGRLFYNWDNDGFYYASRDAVSGDPSTWYKKVSSIDGAVISLGTLGSMPLSGTLAWSVGWSASAPSSTACSGKCVRSQIQTSGGLYKASLSGRYCTGKPTAIQGAPRIVFVWRRWKPGNASAWTKLADSSEDLDLSGPGGCADFSLDAVFLGPATWGLDVGVKGKREFAGDSLQNLTVEVTRILGF